MSSRKINSSTWLDRLPTEIIFFIFDYLSSNDIIYTFFFLNQRFNNLLFQNPRYLTYFQMPTTDLNRWKDILSKIGSKIDCLNINTIHLSFPLKYFPNLKSIIISSPDTFPDEELKSFIKNDQFQNFESFKIKDNGIFCDQSYIYDKDYFFQRIFNDKNSLQILTVPSFYITNIDNLNVNYNLRSITLNMISFENIFLLIQLTPNLEYLNVDSHQQGTNQHQISINKVNIKLKELYLTLRYQSEAPSSFDSLINRIRQFSSSLICLSLNLIHHRISLDAIPFNSIKLQQFLESMIELKQFHVYAQLNTYFMNCDQILSGFRNQFWSDHNWSFGMHGNYLYTLPFHFDYLYEIFGGFNNFKSNNPEILINNPRIWHHVKSIELERSSRDEKNFVKELKIKMPKLKFIKFGYHMGIPKSYLPAIKDEREKIELRLDTVTTVQFTNGSIEDEKDWIISSLPNLRHLILCYTKLPLIDDELARILNERIQRLDINMFSKLDQLIQISSIYFSNVQYIHFCLNNIEEASEQCANYLMKILIDFKNLKTLLVYIHRKIDIDDEHSYETKLTRIIEKLDMNSIMKNYQVKHFREYVWFFKRRVYDSEDQAVTRIHSFFSCVIRSFFRKKGL